MITLFLIIGIVMLIVTVPFILLLIKDLKHVEKEEEYYRESFEKDPALDLIFELGIFIAFASMGIFFIIIGAYPQIIITAYNILKPWFPMIGIN